MIEKILLETFSQPRQRMVISKKPDNSIVLRATNTNGDIILIEESDIISAFHTLNQRIGKESHEA